MGLGVAAVRVKAQTSIGWSVHGFSLSRPFLRLTVSMCLPLSLAVPFGGGLRRVVGHVKNALRNVEIDRKKRAYQIFYQERIETEKPMLFERHMSQRLDRGTFDVACVTRHAYEKSCVYDVLTFGMAQN